MKVVGSMRLGRAGSTVASLESFVSGTHLAFPLTAGPASGGTTRRYLGKFEAMFQFSLSELRGRQINDTIIPEQHVNEAAGLSTRTFSGEIVEKETVRLRKDGTLVPVQIYGVPIFADRKHVGTFVDETVFFIQKPFSPEALATKAREVLDYAGNV